MNKRASLFHLLYIVTYMSLIISAISHLADRYSFSDLALNALVLALAFYLAARAWAICIDIADLWLPIVNLNYALDITLVPLTCQYSSATCEKPSCSKVGFSTPSPSVSAPCPFSSSLSLLSSFLLAFASFLSRPHPGAPPTKHQVCLLLDDPSLT